jgi:hypothetical protein
MCAIEIHMQELPSYQRGDCATVSETVNFNRRTCFRPEGEKMNEEVNRNEIEELSICSSRKQS